MMAHFHPPEWPSFSPPSTRRASSAVNVAGDGSERHVEPSVRQTHLSVAPGASTPKRHDGPIQFKRMECKEKQRLTEEYFDAFKRQQWISQQVEVNQGRW